MRNLVFVALALIAATPAVPAQQVTPAAATSLTLDDAIMLARRNNPAYLAQANTRRTADAAVQSARGAFLPSADASFGTRYTQGGQQVFNGLTFTNSSATKESNYSLNVSYKINSATFVTPKAAMANRDAVEADITGASEQLRATVTQQYLTVLQAQARAALQDTLVATAQTQLDLAKAKMAVGSGTILDIRRAEVGLGQAQVALLQARNNAQVEKLRLFQQIGVPQTGDATLTTEFPVQAPSFTLDALLDLARRANPAILALRSRERSADLNTRVAKAAYTPTLSLFTGWGGYSYQYTNSDYLVDRARSGVLASQASCFQADSIHQAVGYGPLGCNGAAYQFTDAQAAAIRDANNQFPFRFQRSPMSLTAQLSIPVFDNFNREQRLEQAQVDRDNATLNVRAKDLALTADVTQAYLTLTTAAQTVTLNEQIASKAKEELLFAEERYKVGAATFLDVTTSRESYERALADRVTAVYDYHKAFAALENAVGRPLR